MHRSKMIHSTVNNNNYNFTPAGELLGLQYCGWLKTTAQYHHEHHYKWSTPSSSQSWHPPGRARSPEHARYLGQCWDDVPAQSMKATQRNETLQCVNSAINHRAAHSGLGWREFTDWTLIDFAAVSTWIFYSWWGERLRCYKPPDFESYGQLYTFNWPGKYTKQYISSFTSGQRYSDRHKTRQKGEIENRSRANRLLRDTEPTAS